MLREFEGTISRDGLCDIREHYSDRGMALRRTPLVAFRAVLDSSDAEAVLFATAYGQKRYALKLLLDAAVSFERRDDSCLTAYGCSFSFAAPMRTRPQLRLVESKKATVPQSICD